MKKIYLLSLMLGFQIFGMEKTPEVESESLLESLPVELKYLIIKDVIEAKSYNQLKQEIDTLKIVNKGFKNLFNERFVLELSKYSGFSIYQLAKIVLSPGDWLNFKAKYVQEADEAGRTIIDAIKNESLDPNTRLEIINNNLRWANLDIRDDEGQTALIRAVRSNNVKIVKMLIEAGAKADIQDNEGKTALIFACTNSYTEIAKMLIESRAKLDIQGKNGRTALIWGARWGRTEIVKKLIDAGAKLDIQDQYGETALMLGVRWGRTEIVKKLIEAGAKLDIQDNKGKTALMLAKEKGKTKIAQILEEKVKNTA
jgi:Ankyrin repeats (3 copies)/Ankyrin repeats (many copies)